MPKLGWVCSYTPEEIPATLGLDSCRLYGDGGGSSREVAWKYLPANFCPLSRACLEDVLGEQEPLAGVILASSCHAMVHLANALEYTSQCRKLKVYRLDLPRTPGGNNPEAVEALATSLRQLAGELSRDYGVTWDQDTFWQVIEEHQQVRLKLQELDRLRRAHPEVFRAAGLMEVIRTVTRSPKGKSAQLLDNLLGVLRDGQPAGDPEVTRLVTGLRRQGDPRGPRLLVTGSPLAPACLDLIEEVGGNIVGDDLCHGYRYTLPQVEKSGDPWLQLARGYLGRLPCPRMLAVRKRATELLARVREGDAQGIVYHALKFCDPSLYEFPLFKDFIAKAGVPLLYLETEYREGGLEQVRTRLQAFLELLGKEGRG